MLNCQYEPVPMHPATSSQEAPGHASRAPPQAPPPETGSILCHVLSASPNASRSGSNKPWIEIECLWVWPSLAGLAVLPEHRILSNEHRFSEDLQSVASGNTMVFVAHVREHLEANCHVKAVTNLAHSTRVRLL